MSLLLVVVACAPRAAPEPVERPRDAVVVRPAERDPDRWGTARCNDGTGFAYTWRPGRSDTWVINVAGGHFCDDDRIPCSARKPRLRTTLAGADGAVVPMKSDGIFSLDPNENPDFADAHHVDVHYCSSDLWLGDQTDLRPTTGSPDGWYFSGRTNLDALLTSLPVATDFDLSRARVLVLGTSAGGAGVVGNLDRIAERWAPAVADGRVKVVLDGSWIAELPADRPAPDPDRWGPVMPACDAERVARGDDPGGCIVGRAWWPYAERLGVPILVQIAQLDTTHVAAFAITPAEEAAWAATVRASLDGLPWVWSADRSYHVVAIDPLFGKGEPSFREVLGQFWRGGPPVRYVQGAER